MLCQLRSRWTNNEPTLAGQTLSSSRVCPWCGRGHWLAPLPFTPEFGVLFPVSAFERNKKMFLPHPRVKVSIVGSLRDREVACSASDRQGSNFESCVWRAVSSQSSHHTQEVLLPQFSLYVHKGGLKPDSFNFIPFCPWRSAYTGCAWLRYLCCSAKAASAYFTSEKILHFAIAEQCGA